MAKKKLTPSQEMREIFEELRNEMGKLFGVRPPKKLPNKLPKKPTKRKGTRT